MGVTSKNSEAIGVFDSGVGGLSILRELKKRMPNENFIFLADQLNAPYGEKSKKELVELALKITNFFVKKHHIKMMVVACNTATSGALNELREQYSFPIVGTVPAIKTASEKTKTKVIGIISTPATSKSLVLKNLIQEQAKGKKVIKVSCNGLAGIVEEGMMGSIESFSLLSKYLKNIKNSKADYLILGCTHYPFLKTDIKKVIKRPIKIIDSGRAIAEHTKFLLNQSGARQSSKEMGKTAYFTTGNSDKFSQVAGKLLGYKVKGEKVAI